MSDYQPPLVAAVGALTCQLPSTPSSQPVKRRTTSSASTSTTRLSRSSSHKLRRIDEELACPPAAAATTFHSPTPRAFHVNELNHRIKNLFPDPQVLALPCTSARLFACFTLVAESSANQVAEDTPRRSTRRQTTGLLIEPILPHLASLVQAEVASLQAGGESDHRPRRTTFSGFDCSSTKPPVDRVDGSGQHQSHAIQALRQAKESLDVLTNETENQSLAIQCLDRLQHFLQTTLSSPTTESQTLCQLCAESISRHYPPKRLFQAMRIYANEIQATVWRLRGGGQSSMLFIEDHLSSLLCRRIRYQLRLLLNPPPPRLTPRDVDYAQRSKAYSQVFTHVEMLVDGPKNTVYEVDGERLATLVNAALSQVANYFGVENLLDVSYTLPSISSAFCSSEASQRQIPIRSKTPLPPLTLTQIEDVQADIDEAFRVLMVANASQFLMDLLAIPKVQSELKRQGGWGEVETHASLLWRYEIWGIHQEEAHLVLLCNVTTLSKRLSTLVSALQGPSETARVCLTDLGARFRVTTKSVELRRNYPEIATLGEHLREWWEQAQTFPTVLAK